MAASTRDATATRDKILRAASVEFTKRGFAGARVDEIAHRAKVNKALLYHYYRDKEALFCNVLERKMDELSALRMDPANLADAAGAFFDFYAANRDVVRLMTWEALDFGTMEVPNETERCHRFEERVEQIAAAQRAGSIDDTLDARQALATLMGVVSFWFAFPQAARMIAGGDPYSPTNLKKRRAHVVHVARKILEGT